MKKLIIQGGKPLFGEVQISGAKNAALPLMVASILSPHKLTLSNIPQVSDIATMANLLTSLGIEICLDGNHPNSGNQGKVIELSAKNIDKPVGEYDLVSKMRASILILGPLLARLGYAKVSLPGGCAIGTRPVDLHLKALEKLGAKFELVDGYLEGKVSSGKLKGAEIHFEKISVGATENIMMAATLADGETKIFNAACEPEIIDLAKCLNAMGAEISGAGTSQITIKGLNELKSAQHQIIPDRIEAGTYAVAAGITGGKVLLRSIREDSLNGFQEELEEAGLVFKRIYEDFSTKNLSENPANGQFIGLEVSRLNNKIKSVNIATNPYPGFPTDMQAQFMALMTIADGTSTIEENIFENRFMHILELVRMGANIESHGKLAVVKSVNKLKGAEVMATDLRASVSLVLAALSAQGETIINRLYHLERGYERLTEKLTACGAEISIYC